MNLKGVFIRNRFTTYENDAELSMLIVFNDVLFLICVICVLYVLVCIVSPERVHC